MVEKQKTDKVQSDLLFLMLCFKEVLIELKEDELADCLPWINGNQNPSYIGTNESNLPLRAVSRNSKSVSFVTFAVTNGCPSRSPPTQFPKLIRGSFSTLLIRVGSNEFASHACFNFLSWRITAVGNTFFK